MSGCAAFFPSLISVNGVKYCYWCHVDQIDFSNYLTLCIVDNQPNSDSSQLDFYHSQGIITLGKISERAANQCPLSSFKLRTWNGR